MSQPVAAGPYERVLSKDVVEVIAARTLALYGQIMASKR